MSKLYDIPHQIQHDFAPTLILDLQSKQSVLTQDSVILAVDKTLENSKNISSEKLQKLSELLANHSIITSQVSAAKLPGKLYISPSITGEIKHFYIQINKPLVFQTAAFLACGNGIKLGEYHPSTRRDLSLLIASGNGDLWLSACGKIQELLASGSLAIASGYILAFEGSLKYEMKAEEGLSFQGVQTGIMGGKGTVCDFQERGRVWIQSRHPYAWLNVLAPYIS